jgi:mono/diheme cytochrome c family protein
MRYFLSGFLILLLFYIASCTQAPTSPVSEQLSRGKVIYEQGCATETCHGLEGEGIHSDNGFRARPLVGEEFQRRNPTAQVIFDVVRSGGESSLRALTDQQIYDSIAYELSLNEVELSKPLNSQNAPDVISGPAADIPELGSLFPPPGNARLISTLPVSSATTLPIQTENSELRIRLTQIALAASIGEKVAPDGGNYLLAVFTLEDLADHPLEVGPQHLKLVTEDGKMLEPLEIGLNYPVDRFYARAIQPEHGTAAFAIFDFPEAAKIGHMQYNLPDKQQLILNISQ